MADIQLFICCHQPMPVPRYSLFVPVQVGAALADRHFPGFAYDDTGENISSKNRYYCELTAQYWAWKNVDVDYYGFFHYRRYLYPKPDARWPYRVEREPAEKLLDQLGYECFEELIPQYDLIIPKAEDMHMSVRDYYSSARFHHAVDMLIADQIVRERYPEMTAALDEYMDSTNNYFGNIYIMKREIFHDYCNWLFPILDEFDRRADISNYTPQEKRVDGYIAERLFGVYLTYRRDKLRVLELPRVHFYSNKEYMQRKLTNTFFPPGTKRRSIVKKIKLKYENGR